MNTKKSRSGVNMKKVTTGAVALTLLSLALAGCIEPIDERPMMADLKSKTTATEYALLREFHLHHIDMKGYKVLVSNVRARKAAPAEGTPPFCKEIMFMVPNDTQDKGHDIYAQVLSFYPTIETDCPAKVVKQQAVGTTPVEKDGEAYNSVSSETLKELGATAKSCNTAKILITMENALQNISQEKAEEIIKKCHWDKLQEELNK